MAVEPPKDEGLEQLLREISKNIDENQRFISALQDDRLDEGDDFSEAEEPVEAFEEEL